MRARALLRQSTEGRSQAIRRARELRRESTFTERRVWEELRGRKVCGVKFRRQHPVGPFIVDFYAPEFRLAIEVDGPTHELREVYDVERQHFLERAGLRFVRFTAQEVDVDLAGCVERIRRALGR